MLALPLAIASGQIRSVEEFDWIGFLPGRLLRGGRPEMELTVHFEEDEIAATQEMAERWDQSRSEELQARFPFTPPGDSRRVQLRFNGFQCRAGSLGEIFQFRGRFYAGRLIRQSDPVARAILHRLPGIVWFDQYRNLASSPSMGNGRVGRQGNGHDDEGAAALASRISFEVGVGRLRRHLAGWALAKQQKVGGYDADWLREMEQRYRRVFLGRFFHGVELMEGVASPTSDDYYFLFSDGERDYDIAEMSAGEQAVFPILYTFVQRQIGHSVVLIDEVDLNLHPPAAQALVRSLPQLGPDCQFIFTTHSEAVSGVVGPDDTLRLPGGALCL